MPVKCGNDWTLGTLSTSNVWLTFYLVFLIIFTVLQTVLLAFNRLKSIENTKLVLFVDKLIMLGSVVQIHLSPPDFIFKSSTWRNLDAFFISSNYLCPAKALPESRVRLGYPESYWNKHRGKSALAARCQRLFTARNSPFILCDAFRLDCQPLQIFFFYLHGVDHAPGTQFFCVKHRLYQGMRLLAAVKGIQRFHR